MKGRSFLRNAPTGFRRYDKLPAPFHTTDKMLSLLANACEQVGRMTVLQKKLFRPHVQRQNRIRSIHASLAIEGNSLSLEQVAAVLNGRRILGSRTR